MCRYVDDTTLYKYETRHERLVEFKTPIGFGVVQEHICDGVNPDKLAGTDTSTVILWTTC